MTIFERENMSFSGKKYRRTRCVNLHEMLKHSKASPETINCLLSSAPIFSYIRLNEKTFIFKLTCGEKVMTHQFRIGEEFEMEKHDGSKLKMIYTLDGDNIMNQLIKKPDGTVIQFRREFGDINKMTITMPGLNEPAVIYYELVE